MSITLFGNSKNAAHVAGRKRKPKKEKVKKPLKTLLKVQTAKCLRKCRTISVTLIRL